MEIKESIEIIKSLADTSRLRVLNALLQKPHYVEELAQKLDLAVSTVSFHLKKLESAGLAYKTKEQYYIIYHIKEEVIGMPLRELVAFDDIEKYAQEERMEKYRKKVLKAFFKKGKLTKLPVQKKKKMIVLDEFIKKFEAGKEYAEKQVDDIINRTFEDHCAIRRLMIEEGIMCRDKQIYRLNAAVNEGVKQEKS